MPINAEIAEGEAIRKGGVDSRLVDRRKVTWHLDAAGKRLGGGRHEQPGRRPRQATCTRLLGRIGNPSYLVAPAGCARGCPSAPPWGWAGRHLHAVFPPALATPLDRGPSGDRCICTCFFREWFDLGVEIGQRLGYDSWSDRVA